MAAAPTILEAAPATSVTPAATPAAAPVSTAPGFDAILMLQNLAATMDSLDGATLDAENTADLLSGDDDLDDDEAGEELEASLAFLSSLLTATQPKGSPGDFQPGGQSPEQGAEDAGPSLKTLAGALPEASILPDEFRTTDKPAASSALAAIQPELLETRTSGEGAQTSARVAELLAQAPRAPSTPSSMTTTVLTHARDPRWSEDFSTRISLLVRAGESTASLQLTPVDLGPVEVNVTVKDSQATIHFGASQADTRALIEASLPKLRELLASQGFSLLDASVSSGFSRPQPSPGRTHLAGDGETDLPEADGSAVRKLGLLDLYA